MNSQDFEEDGRSDELELDDSVISEGSIDNENIEDSEEDLAEDLIRIHTQIESSESVSVQNVAGDSYNFQVEKNAVKASPLNPKILEKINNVYVMGENYSRALRKAHNSRILVICGAQKLGKYATAIKIALQLKGELGLAIYSLRFSDVAFLTDFLEEDDCPKKSVFVIKDAFKSPGLDPIELEKHINDIGLLLDIQESYVILTNDDSLEDVEISDEYVFGWVGIDQRYLCEIFSKHLVYYAISQPTSSLVSSKLENIIGILARPYEIDKYVRYLKDAPIVDASSAEELAYHIVDTKQEADKWFSSLSLNEKYFAMLTGLLENTDWRQFYELYQFLINKLRSEGVNLEAALGLEINQLLEKTRTGLTEFDTIVFEDIDLQEYVVEKTNGNYYPQFTYLISYLANYTNIKFSGSNKNEREMRIAIASAVGELGKSSQKLDRIQPTLEIWANSNINAMRAVPAYSLLQIVEDKNFIEDVKKFITRWRKHNNWKLRWSYAAALERLYSYLPTFALEGLFISGRDTDKRVSQATAHALIAIGRREIADSFSLIETWLDSDNAYGQRTAIRAFFQIIRFSKIRDAIFENDEHLVRLLAIFVRIAVRNENTMRRSIDALGSFLDREQLTQQQVEYALWNIWVETSSTERGRIERYLDQMWFEQPDSQKYRLALVLLDRFEMYVDENTAFRVKSMRYGEMESQEQTFVIRDRRRGTGSLVPRPENHSLDSRSTFLITSRRRGRT